MNWQFEKLDSCGHSASKSKLTKTPETGRRCDRVSAKKKKKKKNRNELQHGHAHLSDMTGCSGAPRLRREPAHYRTLELASHNLAQMSSQVASPNTLTKGHTARRNRLSHRENRFIVGSGSGCTST
jgi:hypothetical protein